RSRDVVATTHVEPADATQQGIEARTHGVERALERIGAELTKRMKVDTVQTVVELRRMGSPLLGGGPQAGSRCARVVELDPNLAMLGVEAKPELDTTTVLRLVGVTNGAEFLPLRG